MIQGGKSKVKGDEGSSYWNKPFSDEFDDRLTHSGGGILSMANSGPNTNGRQFFITYKSCPHLNRKHTVFGKVIGGMDVLRRLEEVPTDTEDRPIHTIEIVDVEIMENPVEEAIEMERVRILKRKEEKREASRSRSCGLVGKGAESGSKSLEDGAAANSIADTSQDTPLAIGKYMKDQKDKPSKKRSAPADEKDLGDEVGAAIKSRLPPPPKKTTFGDFSGW
jgi:peptidyl-prolyl cis-trans isomerase-like protein 2